MKILITSPSLDTNKNVSGISSVTKFIIGYNIKNEYLHFELGRKDNEKRNLIWLFRILGVYMRWSYLMVTKKDILIHFNLPLDKDSIIRDSPLILFARLCHKSMVIHLHGGEYLHRENIPKWIRIILRFIFSGNEPIIVLSLIEKNIIVNQYHAKNVVDLPNCIDIEEARKYNRVYRSELSVKLLFIGRIVKRKGLESIIQALTELKKREIDFKFILAGTGPDKSDYVNRCSLIFGSAFEFKGVVSGPKKAELLKECDIFLLPSLYGEGLPISLLECMSFGLVPLVTDDGSMKYIIKTEENGIIVEKGSSISLAEAIENLVLNKELIAKIGKNARQYVFENHDPKVYINKLNKIYKNALELKLK